MIFIEHELTAHLPTEVIKSFEIDEGGEIKEKIEAESHRPEHTMGDRVSCSCGEEWEGVKAEEEAKKHLRKATATKQIPEKREGKETGQKGDTGFQVSCWEDELVEDVESVLNDISELEEKKVEAETAAFTAKLLLQVTDGDWKQSEGIAAVLEDFFRNEATSEEAGEETGFGDGGEEDADEPEEDSDDENEVIISSE